MSDSAKQPNPKIGVTYKEKNVYHKHTQKTKPVILRLNQAIAF